jgi:hypothetical protein
MKTTTKQKIAIMQAAADGKDILFRERYVNVQPFTQVRDLNGIPWNWVDYDYKVKQEPLEFWINIYYNDIKNEHGTIHKSKDIAIENKLLDKDCETIKVIQVIE